MTCQLLKCTHNNNNENLLCASVHQKRCSWRRTQQCKSILETIMIQIDNDGKSNTILYALRGEHIKNKSTCKII